MDIRDVLHQHADSLARELADLCEDQEQRDGIIALNGHLVLIGLLGAGPDSDTTEYALKALMDLIFENTARKLRLLQAGVVAPTVALLDPTDENIDIITNATCLLSNLSDTSEGVKAIQEAGGIAVLVSLLEEEEDIALNAVSVLCDLSWDPDTEESVNRDEIFEAGAIPAVVALLRGETGYNAVGVIRNLAAHDLCAAAICANGAIGPLVALLHATEEVTADDAMASLLMLAQHYEQSQQTILSALAARPPPTPVGSKRAQNDAKQLLKTLQPIATKRLRTAEAGDDGDALQAAIDQAAAAGVTDAKLRPTRKRLAAMRDAVETARRERRTWLGLDELKTPDEFVCPITHEVMQDPVVASDGHTYERWAIQEVLYLLPIPRRKSPLTREVLSSALFPNRALKNRMAAHEQEVEAAAEKGAQKAVEAQRTSVAARKRPSPTGETWSAAPPGSRKRGRRL